MFSNGNGNNTGFFMPVAPAYGNGGGFGNFGGDGGWWLLVLLLAVMNGGWGGFGGFGWGGMGGMMGLGMMDGMGLYPWLNNSQNINGGFRDQQISTQLSAIQQGQTSGFGDVQLGIAGINQNICQTGNGVINALNANQLATLQQLFGIQSAQQQCCCDNRAATADVKYTVAAEAAATRASASADTQRVLDKLCQLELDNVKLQLAAEQRENANLRSDLQYARGQASQVAQTAELRANQATVANQLISELRSCPIPAQPVYGSQPIFTCQGNYSGCGCGGFAAA